MLRHKSPPKHREIHSLGGRIFSSPENDEFIVKVAETKEEAIKLLEVGFTNTGNIRGYEMFRKRK